MSGAMSARADHGDMRVTATGTGGTREIAAVSQANIADRIQSVAMFALATAITLFVSSGKYLSYVTPRSIPYLVIAAAGLAMFSVAAWFGVFRCTAASLSRTLVVVIIPTLLMAVPIGTASTSLGGTNRAIAITTSGVSHLSGLDAAHKTITVTDDQFGAWFDQIDHHPDTYVGYRVIVSGFVSADSSMGAHQFETSRMLMTCCVLDMTPFGFVVNDTGHTLPTKNTWVTVTGTLSQGRIGTKVHGYDGIVLTAQSVVTGTQTPSGYFYRS